MTQAQLSATLGVSQRWLSELETGKSTTLDARLLDGEAVGLGLGEYPKVSPLDAIERPRANYTNGGTTRRGSSTYAFLDTDGHGGRSVPEFATSMT